MEWETLPCTQNLIIQSSCCIDFQVFWYKICPSSPSKEEYNLVHDISRNLFFLKLIIYYLILLQHTFIITMFNFVRKVVAGPKKTTNFQGEQLDLTYITNRIIAMAFPASEIIQKTYRNPIDQVAAYLDEQHGINYFIFNVSSRFYDHSEFSGRVKDYEWPDHQSPPLTTLVEIGFDMLAYLRGNVERVVAVHCNHGKGRTGTAIITLMLLAGYFNSSSECLKYYNQKRFNNKSYGVDQPCQLRYLRFMEQILTAPKIDSKLVCYRLCKVNQRGLNSSCFVNIYSTRTQKLIFERLEFDILLDQKLKTNIMIGDIFIEVVEQTWMGLTRIARINFHLYFNPQSLQLTFHSQHIKLENPRFQDFEISFNTQYFCLCHLPTYSQTVCSCKLVRDIEQAYWNYMISQIRECKKIVPADSIMLIQGELNTGGSKDPQLDELERRQKAPLKRDVEGKGELVLQSKFKSTHKQKLCALVQMTMQRKIDMQQSDNLLLQKPLSQSQEVRILESIKIEQQLQSGKVEPQSEQQQAVASEW